VWARYTFALLLAFIISNPLSRPGLCERAPCVQIVRAAILLASTMLNFFALKYLRLDQVLAITFRRLSSSRRCPGRHSVNGLGRAAGPPSGLIHRRSGGDAAGTGDRPPGRNPGHSGGIRLRGLFPDDSRPVA